MPAITVTADLLARSGRRACRWQIYGWGGQYATGYANGATQTDSAEYTWDYVELHNNGLTDVNLTGCVCACMHACVHVYLVSAF